MKRTIAALLAALLLLAAVPVGAEEAFPPAGELIPGIDVSVWQGEINFEQVRASGVRIVYIRASAGQTTIDARFRRNYAGFKAQGLQIGLYHYLTARTQEQALEQARFFAETIAGTQPDCRLAADFERTDGLTAQQASDIVLAFLEEVERLTGLDVVLYSDAWGARSLWTAELTRYPLWVADYGASSPEPNGKWSVWAGWQYTDRGEVPGISGNVDLDRFTPLMLLDSPTPTPGPTPTPAPSYTCVPVDAQRYVVRRGDTLSAIAQRFDVGVNAIAARNGIENVNQIYAGQELFIPVYK